MTTITASSSFGIVLTAPPDTNPVVINPGVTITGNTGGGGGNGISAPSGIWTITNYGTVAGVGTGGNGIYLAAGGAVTNEVSGVIGSPASDPSAIYILGGAGAVTNYGAINAGVWLKSGGTVTNDAGGSIISQSTSGGYGVGLLMGGTVTNAGQISGLLVGIDASHLGGTVANQTGGTISGPYVGVLMGIVDGPSPGGRNLTNQAGGTISGDSGVLTGGDSAMVINAGVIAGTYAGTVSRDSFTLAVGTGVSMSVGGTVTNQLGGTISGASHGIYISNGAGTVVNAGQIIALGTTLSRGVALFAGGYLSNAATGTISATSNGNAVRVQAATGTVVNAGTLIDNFAGRAALAMQAGGRVTNVAGGLIQGGAWNGVYGTGGAVTIVNAGIIAGIGGGSAHSGIQLMAGGEVTNAASGSIIGGVNITLASVPGTVINDGTIATTGTAFTTGRSAVYFTGAAGTVFNTGQIIASGTTLSRGVALFAGGYLSNAATGTISATGNGNAVRVQAAAGTIVNAGTLMNNFAGRAALALQAGGLITNVAGGLIQGGAWNGIYGTGGAVTIVNAGTIAGIGGGSTHSGVQLVTGGTLTNAGTIIGSSGTAVYFGGTGNNELVLDPGFGFAGVVDASASASNVLELASSSSAGSVTGLGTEFINFGSIIFDTGADWFVAGNTAGLAGTISGFAFGDTIEVAGITATGSSYVGSVLTLNEASGSVELTLPGSFATSDFVVTNVAAGADVSLAAPCFVAGTRIHTEHGAIAVEILKKGDQVPVVMGGKPLPIVWLGYRQVDCKRHPNPKQVWPVCLSRNAFGPGRPFRDLWLSPDHALFIDGVLIPIRYLVNGKTIFQQARDEVTYWHVELAQHNVLNAEGVPAESYLDTGNRSAFANGGATIDLHADFTSHIWDSKSCAPLVLRGPKLATAKHRLLAQATVLGHVTTHNPSLKLLANGKPLKAAIDGRTWRARLPKAARSVRLISRIWTPAHMEPDTNDARSLGVAIAQLRLDGREIELNHPRLTRGWHASEQEWRWTDGDGWIGTEDARDLAFDVMMTGSYWWDEMGDQTHALSGD